MAEPSAEVTSEEAVVQDCTAFKKQIQDFVSNLPKAAKVFTDEELVASVGTAVCLIKVGHSFSSSVCTHCSTTKKMSPSLMIWLSCA